MIEQHDPDFSSMIRAVPQSFFFV
eukprot:SAG11_NODE_1635_length_4539_cov_2.188514_1_plen_23_part_10